MLNYIGMMFCVWGQRVNPRDIVRVNPGDNLFAHTHVLNFVLILFLFCGLFDTNRSSVGFLFFIFNVGSTVDIQRNRCHHIRFIGTTSVVRANRYRGLYAVVHEARMDRN